MNRITLLLCWACAALCLNVVGQSQNSSITVGAERTTEYLPDLRGKNVAIVANHTSFIGEKHIVDSLLSAQIEVVKVFAPEHGFRGKADAGATIKDGKDAKTGLPIVSLYGKNKKPSSEQLKGIDIVIFDIQDVGVRYYTYISTMHYVMEACAEQKVEFWVMDRPNPNGNYVDGPVLDTVNYRSFVGMHPIPVVHGLTVGELAHMIQGEHWIAQSNNLKLRIIACKHYTHDDVYELPISPSPNLRSMKAIYLYPYLGFFEGTPISVGRGTQFPFEVYGYPTFETNFSFTPEPTFGAKHPKLEGQECFGYELNPELLKDQSVLFYVYLAYGDWNVKKAFFNSNNFFDLLAGTDQIRLQIENGARLATIEDSYAQQLKDYKLLRNKYLLYPLF